MAKTGERHTFLVDSDGIAVSVETLTHMTGLLDWATTFIGSQRFQQPILMFSTGPWRDDNLLTATESFFQTNAYLPFATCILGHMGPVPVSQTEAAPGVGKETGAHRAASGELWSWTSSSDRQTLRDSNVSHNHALDTELGFKSCRPGGPRTNTSAASVEKPRSTGTRHPRVRAKAEPYLRAPGPTPRALEPVPDYLPRFNTAGQNTTVSHNYPRRRRSGLFGGLPWQQD